MCLATVPPGDQESEHQVQTAEPEPHPEAGERWWREERHRAQEDETGPHDRHHPHGKGSAGDEARTVKQQPGASQRTVQLVTHQHQREQATDRDRRRYPRKNRRALLVSTAPSSRRALAVIVTTPIALAIAATPSQVTTHARGLVVRADTKAPITADMPIAIPPHPGTAVNADARSIVSRMKLRLSIARECRAGTSDGGSIKVLCSIK